MKKRLPEIALILATLIWGGSFLGSQLGLREIGVLGMVATRFSIGTIVLALCCAKTMRGSTRAELRAGMILGVIFFATIALQTAGLRLIPTSKSAFITSVGVPIVPFFQLLLMRRAPSVMARVGIGLSSVGLVLLSLRADMSLSFGLGEWLTLGAAVFSALHIVLTSQVSVDGHPLRVTTFQLGTVALLAFIGMPMAGETFPHFTVSLTTVSLLMGIFPTAICFLVMVWAQQTVSPTRATVIYSTEPVWAAAIGLAIGEIIPPIAYAGAALILLGILSGEIKFRVAAPAV